MKIGSIPINWMVRLADGGRQGNPDRTITNSGNFAAFVAAVTIKYGKPTTVNVAKVQNGFGAVFDDATARWKRRDGEVAVYRRFANVNDSVVVYSSPVAVAEDAARSTERAKKGAAGL